MLATGDVLTWGLTSPALRLHARRAAPRRCSAGLTQAYGMSMTDEVPPLRRDGEASAVGLRASHADRDRVVELLQVAAGDGRLTPGELDERLEAALSARTRGELAALTTDLTAASGSAAGSPVLGPRDLVRLECRSSSSKRGGHWLVPHRMEVRVTKGDVTLDFTEAVISQPMLMIDADVSSGLSNAVDEAWHCRRHRRRGGRQQLREGPGEQGSRSACRILADSEGVRHGRRRAHHGPPAAPDLAAMAAPGSLIHAPGSP